jgi:CDP-diacylglycerol--glycerol-3-phosphate 3-phosphatidyltransferase
MSAVPTAAAGRQEPGRGFLARFKDRLRDGAHGVLAPVVRMLARLGVQPDWLTILGAVFSLAAALAFFEGAFRWGSAALVAAGLCDILDGQLARASGFETRFGAFLDSTLDRLSEALVFVGIAGFYMVHLIELAHNPTLVLTELSRDLEPGTWVRVALLAMLALVGSFLVSYTRARAEGLGLDCKVGWAERPERMVALIIAGLFGVSRMMPAVLMLLTVMCFFTAGQRVAYVWRSTRGSEEHPGPERR